MSLSTLREKLYNIELRVPTIEEMKDFSLNLYHRLGWKGTLAISSIALSWAYSKFKNRIRCNTILEIDMRKINLEEKPISPLQTLLDESVVQGYRIAEAIRKAATDNRIKGLVVNAGSIVGTISVLDEIREAVLEFKKSGKKAFYYTDSFNEAFSSTVLYWFASAFDEIHMSKAGSVNNIAFSGIGVFLRKMLDKIEAKPSFFKRKEYKNAINLFTEEKFTDEHRENTDYIVNSIYNKLLEDISAARNIKVDELKEIFKRAPLTAQDAIKWNLIDKLNYEDEFYETFLPTTFNVSSKKYLNLLSVHKYRSRVGGLYAKGKHHIALIYLTGTIFHGQGEKDIFGEEKDSYSQSICKAIKQATKDSKIKAIVIRVDSPGGSALGSDVIARAIYKAKQSGKKIIVSMGQYAASGGYYVSAYAHRIVASPFTLTGSIGVIYGKINLRDTFGKLGITFDETEAPENSHFFSPLHSFEKGNEEKVNHLLDDIYDRFKGIVSEGRSLPSEKTEELAKGRVWVASEEIREKGLIDEIGGLHDAIDIAKKELGLYDKDTICVRRFPSHGSLLSRLTHSDDNTQSLFIPRGIMNIMYLFNGLFRIMNGNLPTPFRLLLNIVPLIKMNQKGEIVFPVSLYAPINPISTEMI